MKYVMPKTCSECFSKSQNGKELFACPYMGARAVVVLILCLKLECASFCKSEQIYRCVSPAKDIVAHFCNSLCVILPHASPKILCICIFICICILCICILFIVWYEPEDFVYSPLCRGGSQLIKSSFAPCFQIISLFCSLRLQVIL